MTGETFKATAIMQHDDGTGIVVDYGYWDDGGGSAHIDTANGASAFQTLVKSAMLACMVLSVKLVKYRFACVSQTHKGEVGYVEESSPVAGSLESDGGFPKEIAIALKRSTGYASRRDRGRIFWGPVGAEFRNPDSVDKCQTTTALNTLRDTLKANLTVGAVTLKPVILAADGTFSGRIIIRAAIGDVFVHRKSRRVRQAV